MLAYAETDNMTVPIEETIPTLVDSLNADDKEKDEKEKKAEDDEDGDEKEETMLDSVLVERHRRPFFPRMIESVSNFFSSVQFISVA